VLASDDERERAVIALRDATVAGRLTLDEFSDRVGSAELARTSGELDAVLAGLPAVGSSDLPVSHSATFSRLQRSGRWALAPVSTVRSVCGTIDLDLGSATLAGRDTTLLVKNWFGTITILVPRGIEVSVDGSGPLSTREIHLPDSGVVPDAPRLRIHTSGVGGTLRIRSA
jgi:uncharacterized protein DUF1707/cell wall-active antibiotic response 4TMS protein YvqF